MSAGFFPKQTADGRKYILRTCILDYVVYRKASNNVDVVKEREERGAIFEIFTLLLDFEFSTCYGVDICMLLLVDDTSRYVSQTSISVVVVDVNGVSSYMVRYRTS